MENIPAARDEVQTLPVTARPTGLARIGVKDAEARPLASARDGRQAAQIQKLLLSRFAPCSMVVDEHGTIVYIHGRTGLYLEPAEGQPRNNVVDMAREGLKQALQGSLGRALREKTEIVRDPVRVKTNGGHTDTSLTVTPIQEPESLRGLLLVTIRPAQTAPKPRRTAAGEEPGRSHGNPGTGPPVRPGVAPVDHRRSADLQRGAAGLERGAAVYQRGASEHQRGAGNLEGGDAVPQ